LAVLVKVFAPTVNTITFKATTCTPETRCTADCCTFLAERICFVHLAHAGARIADFTQFSVAIRRWALIYQADTTDAKIIGTLVAVREIGAQTTFVDVSRIRAEAAGRVAVIFNAFAVCSGAIRRGALICQADTTDAKIIGTLVAVREFGAYSTLVEGLACIAGFIALLALAADRAGQCYV
jgi:hypothetical protein